MFRIKKSAYIAIVAATGLLFLIFLFIRIDGLKVAKKNYMAACTETTWGTVTSVYSDSHGPGPDDERVDKIHLYCEWTDDPG